jgi:hypothetical protein
MFKLHEKSAFGPHITRSAMQMNSRAKIRPDSIEQAHRALDALPEHRPEELTKTQAIQRLIVPIRATQSKGYSLAAIGKVLSDSGIPITTGALRAYVSEANAGARGKRKHKAKHVPKAAKETRPGAASSSPKATTAKPPEPATKGAGAVAPRNVDLDSDPATPSERSLREQEAAARRQGFYIRPDTKNI